jgi:hypothetical protein
MATAAKEIVSEPTSDLLHDLSRRLDSFWRYDQYISNCDGEASLKDYWRDIQGQEQANIQALKALLRQRALSGHF